LKIRSILVTDQASIRGRIWQSAVVFRSEARWGSVWQASCGRQATEDSVQRSPDVVGLTVNT